LKNKLSKNTMSILVPIISVIIALLIAAVVILLIGKNPLNAYWVMLKGAFGGKAAWAANISKMMSLVLTGLAVGFGFRAGIFNIGAEGQLMMGAIFSTYVGINLGNVSPIIAIPITMLAGILGGALWASIAGYLKASTGAHEVITTIMLNWIAVYLTNYFVAGPLGTGNNITIRYYSFNHCSNSCLYIIRENNYRL